MRPNIRSRLVNKKNEKILKFPVFTSILTGNVEVKVIFKNTIHLIDITLT